jgi:hypothetical protein
MSTFSESTPVANGISLDVCVDCPLGSYIWKLGSSSASDCKCGSGSFWDGEFCSPCLEGTFSTGGFSAIGDALNTCQQCPEGSTSPIYSKSPASCKCNTGLYWNEVADVCTECEVGTYSTSTPMAVGPTDTSVCKSCPAGSTSLAGSSHYEACECTAGLYWSGTACTECPENTFGDTIAMASGEANNVCADCPAGSTSPAGSSNPEACVTGI